MSVWRHFLEFDGVVLCAEVARKPTCDVGLILGYRGELDQGPVEGDESSGFRVGEEVMWRWGCFIGGVVEGSLDGLCNRKGREREEEETW